MAVFKNLFLINAYIFSLFLMMVNLPKGFFLYQETRSGLLVLGWLGIWRYSWWTLHVIRALIYAHFIFPTKRRAALRLWQSGVRPSRIFFMMTTYQERAATTNRVLSSIWEECGAIGLPVKLFIGIGAENDEVEIQQFIHENKANFPLEIHLVKQKLPGKRFAIGETLRAILAEGLAEEDPVIFMDGDTFLKPGCLSLCLPFFSLNPELQALTTHEQAVVFGAPTWMRKWLELRFVQRHFTMQSYALSGKVLTLTGRMSIFRGKYLLEPEFIEIVENDHLTHWLWGKYRFLSGDDKSTWYYLLKKGAAMLYVPDATTVTIEYIEKNALNRMKENLKRWSGNTLRNGARAIALGPKRVGFFIWWCLVDQRLAMWNIPIGLMIVLVLSLTKTPCVLLIYFLWIAFSRFCLSLVLFYFANRIDITYPFIIYFNQLMNSFIKIYILFRLPQQRWKNRGDQSAGFQAQKNFLSPALVANYLTLFYFSVVFFIVLMYLRIIDFPALIDIKVLNFFG